MTAKFTSDSAAARTYTSAGRAYASARRLATTLGTGVNHFGQSGHGLLAVGCIDRTTYVVYHATLGWIAR